MAKLIPVEDEPRRGARLVPVDEDSFSNDVRNLAGGVTRSGMGIVSNLMRPFEALIPGGEDFDSGNKKRMARVNERFVNQGYDPESPAFQGGKFTGDVAITAPVGGLLGKGVQAVSQAPRAVQFANALSSGGIRAGIPSATMAGKTTNAVTRIAGGAGSGAAMTGIINADDVGTGAVIGGALPVVGAAGGVVADKVLRPVARKLMQSAIKPTIEQLRKGDAQVAIDTLLKYGISPNEKGVYKLRGLVDDLNTQISDKISSSRATVSRPNVLSYLGDVNKKFANQVSPSSDLAAIQGVADDFIAHPALSGTNIPVQQAQQLKQGTYKALSGKYGEAGSAATEAQKALARGLKDEVGKAIPDIVPLNAEEARLIKTLGVTERRALMELNKNPVGLSALAQSPGSFAAFMADRSAAFKAILARMVNQSAKAPAVVNRALEPPVVRSGLLNLNTD